MTQAQIPHQHELAQLVGRVAWYLEKEATPGEVAALRRLKPGDPACLPFWKIVALHLDEAIPPDGESRGRLEERWGVIISALAELQGLHQPANGLGRALFHTAYSEMRLLRLLRAHEESLVDAVRTTAHFLRSNAESSNLCDLARLVLSDGRRDEEQVRRQIARDYYSADAKRMTE